MTRRWVMDNVNNFLTRIDILKLRNKLRGIKLFCHKLRYKKLMSLNRRLKDIHQGQRFVIFGNGLSILEADIENIKGCVTFGCNEIYQHPDFASFGLDYYTVGEPYYGPILGRKYLEDVVKLYSEINNAFASPKTTHLYHATLRAFFNERSLLQGVSQYYYVARSSNLESKNQPEDLTKPIYFSHGAIELMIVAAIYMGAKEIYIVGCGYTYSPVQELHFYDSPSIDNLCTVDKLADFERELLSKYQDREIEKFIEVSGRQYYSLTRERAAAHYEKYWHLQAYAGSHGVRIVNVTPDRFTSPVFEKINMSEFMKLTESWQ